MKELNDGIFTVKFLLILVPLRSDLRVVPSLAWELVVSKENGTLNVKSAVENNTAYFDAYGLSVRITKRAADAIAQTNLILQGKFVREATPNEISAGIYINPCVLLFLISGDNTIKYFSKGRLILESIRGGKLMIIKRNRTSLQWRIRALFSVASPPPKNKATIVGVMTILIANLVIQATMELLRMTAVRRRRRRKKKKRLVRAGPAQRRSDRSKVNSKSFQVRRKSVSRMTRTQVNFQRASR